MPLLSVSDLAVTFDVRPQGAWPWTKPLKLQAVGGLSFDLEEGETLGLVGESGSGKSTVARAIVGTVPHSAGRIVFQGQEIGAMTDAPAAAIARMCRWCSRTRWRP
jgi:ABC-type oligopeptide transport system, ATPase component